MMRDTDSSYCIWGWIKLSLLMVGGCLLAACSVVDIRETVSYDGKRGMIPEAVYENIRPGETTREWLVEQIGEPDKIAEKTAQKSIWIYRFEEKHNNRFRILFLLTFNSVQLHERHIFVELKNAVVQHVWKDFLYRPVIIEPEEDMSPPVSGSADMSAVSKKGSVKKITPVSVKGSAAVSTTVSTTVSTKKPVSAPVVLPVAEPPAFVPPVDTD